MYDTTLLTSYYSVFYKGVFTVLFWLAQITTVVVMRPQLQLIKEGVGDNDECVGYLHS